MHLIRAYDSMFLFIDFVRVTNCFYDYDFRESSKIAKLNTHKFLYLQT